MIKTFTLSLSLLLCGVAFGQIPNASFDTWTAHTGYDTPDSWGNTNSLTTAFSTYTCVKGTGGAPSAGSNYLKLTTKNCGVVVPGVAVTGNIALAGTSVSISGGFANTTRPATLTGQCQFMAASATDHAHIIVFLSKWNSGTSNRDTVAFIDSALTGMAMSWSPFTVTLNYLSGKVPDSAMIVLSSSNLPPATSAAVNSYLYVDALAFAGNVPAGVVTVVNDHAATIIYPNPASDYAVIYYYSLFSGQMNINITDMSGKTVRTMTTQLANGSNNIALNLAGLLKGEYFVYLSNGMGTESTKLIIN